LRLLYICERTRGWARPQRRVQIKPIIPNARQRELRLAAPDITYATTRSFEQDGVYDADAHCAHFPGMFDFGGKNGEEDCAAECHGIDIPVGPNDGEGQSRAER
jgi:hypothetical protein